MSYSDIDLLQMQAEALFVQDSNCKLVRINEPEPISPAPHFYLARSTGGNLWRTHCDLPVELAAKLEALAADEPVERTLAELPRYAVDYTELLEKYAPNITTESGPAYILPQNNLPTTTVKITVENAHLLAAHFGWLLNTLADYAPVIAMVMDGKAVAVCFCSRLTARVAEAGVYTVAAYRGHGHAMETVRQWSQEVYASGRQPLYETSWTNYASQAVARKLGAVQYGVHYSIR
jgi:RimJ/RimL family protein N-acetyltransferase